MDEQVILYITQSITLVLLLWSEYLGVTPQHKSNAITDLVSCLIRRRDGNEEEVRRIVITPPGNIL